MIFIARLGRYATKKTNPVSSPASRGVRHETPDERTRRLKRERDARYRANKRLR